MNKIFIKLEAVIYSYIKEQYLKALNNKNMDIKKKFNKRAFITFGMLVSGMALPVTGLINHNLGFSDLTVSRHFWMSVHNISGILFTIFAVTHIILNSHAIKNYMNKMKSVIISREAFAALMLVAFITVVFASHAFIAH